MLIRLLMTSLKMTIKDQYAVSVFSLPPPPFLSIKPLAPLVSVREELAFGQMSTLSLAQLLASEIKQTLLSIYLACLLAFGQ